MGLEDRRRKISNSFLFFNWEYRSYEVGVLYEAATPANSHWHFESVTHSATARLGLTPPGYNYSESFNYTVPNISQDKRSAIMAVSLTWYQVNVLGGSTKNGTVQNSTPLSLPN